MKKYLLLTLSSLICSLMFSQTVTVINQTNPTCPGMCNGSVTFSISGGTAPYAITNVGSTTCTFPPYPPVMTNTFTINGLCACAYNFLFTDATMLVMGIQIVTLITPPPMNAIFTKTNVCCSSSCNGAINAIIVGGTSPYTYSWTPVVANTSSISNLCAGNYSLTVIDSQGCVGSFTSTVTQPSVFTLTSSVMATSCSTCCTGQINVTGIGGQPGYTYTVFPGNITNATGTFSNLCAGVYSVCASDAGCCNTCIGVTVTSATSTTIIDLQNNHQIKFYPNPGNGIINIDNKLTGTFTVEVLDALGNIILTEKLSQEINLSKQKDGLYFIVLKDLEQRIITRERIIINR